ncbi:MAG TPA: DUF6005 family protein [Polyangiaceae bacterium]
MDEMPMIRVHCFVSCVCEALQRAKGVDQRPFYFGVWDAPFHVTDDYVLAYHRPGSTQSFFCEWYERLYGVKIHDWYDPALSKQENSVRASQLIEHCAPRRNVLVMLDLFRLPERENKYNQNPFPHYVMLRPTSEPEKWLMQDPDFRWEGVLEKQRVLDAMASPAVDGGYYFDEESLRPAGNAAVRAYFETCLRSDHPFTEAIRTIVSAHLDGRAPAGTAGLTRALRELPALALRKYAYEHGFAFFWRALGLDHAEFLAWCDRGEELVKRYTLVQYRAMKLAITGDRSLVPRLFDLLEEQEALETRIKHRLTQVFRAWCSRLSSASERAGVLDPGVAQ